MSVEVFVETNFQKFKVIQKKKKQGSNGIYSPIYDKVSLSFKIPNTKNLIKSLSVSRFCLFLQQQIALCQQNRPNIVSMGTIARAKYRGENKTF
jgi:hypothetical protein